MNVENPNTLIEAKNLTIGYLQKTKNITLLKNLNFTFQKGKLIGLIGVNGIGKTTLLKTISGLLPPIEGNLLINHKNIKNFSLEEIAKQIAIVLTNKEESSKNLTVEEFISLGRQPYTNWLGQLTKQDYLIIEQAKKITQTKKIEHKYCYQLSDGQFQRVAIARAIAQDTPLIVLDEPTTHLDLYHRVSLLKLLKNLCVQTQKTILFATHEIDLALQATDLTMLLHQDILYLEQPKNLIKIEAFKSLFPKDSLIFNEQTLNFTFKFKP